MLKEGRNKRGQLALFIIFGILIFMGIIVLFLLLPSPEIFDSSIPKNPIQEIQGCITKSLDDVLPVYLKTGLYFDPQESLIYSGETIAYHCSTSEKNKICLRNDAQNKNRIENELKEKIFPEVEKCFLNFKNSYNSYEIDMEETILSLEILPGKININTKKNIKMNRLGEEPISYSNFDTFINSPLFDFIILSNEILNEEVSCNCPGDSCTADTTKLMRYNNKYTFTVYIGGNYEKVYTIGNYYNDEKFRFAIKNCDKSP